MMTSGGSKCDLPLLHEKGVKRESTDNHKHRDEDSDSGKGEDEEHDVKSMHKVIRESGSHHPGNVKLYHPDWPRLAIYRGCDSSLLLIDWQQVPQMTLEAERCFRIGGTEDEFRTRHNSHM